jgi:RHS repeat-associated protein
MKNMKIKKYIPVKLLLLSLLQMVFLTQTALANDSYITTIKNSVKTIVPLTGVTEATQLNTNNSLVTVEYSDGLGQTNAVVQKEVTPSKKDLVTLQNSDYLGRPTIQWLPVSVTAATIPDPATVIQQAKTLYNDNMPYNSVGYDINSKDYVQVSACKPGAVRHNQSKVVKQEWLNSGSPGALFIRQYSVTNDGKVLLTEDTEGTYTVAALKTTDEDGKVSYTFSDIYGKTLLIRQVDNTVYHDTYYVYNDMGQLSFMLSPEASDRMGTAGTYSVDSSPLAEYAYAYKYDENGRCTAKKGPGKDWAYMWYDVADHLVFSQDGNQRVRNDQWTYYKYDALSRLIQSGITYGLTGSSIMETYNKYPSVETYETGKGYTSLCPLGSSSVLLTQNFYDTYNFLKVATDATLQTKLAYAVQTGFDEKYSNVVDGVDIATRGMLTGTMVKVLDNSTLINTSMCTTLYKAMYYNDKGQVVQLLANNHMNGYDKDYYTYNFAGQSTRNKHIHQVLTNTPLIENYKFKYDQAGRMVSIRHAISPELVAAPEVLMDSLVYDELGRVATKIIGNGMQTINYAYNLQNQMKSISSPLFSETIHYDDALTGANSYYNGNISAVEYGAGNGFKYSYDGFNRLTTSTFNSSTQAGAYSENIGGYDKNGNITKLTRAGYAYNLSQAGSHAGPSTRGIYNIDDLTLTYSGNQLTSVADASNRAVYVPVGSNSDFADKQDAKYPTEYLYDKNGNQSSDLNKGIAWTKYNVVNLPEKIQFANGNTNDYVYDASGVKQQMQCVFALNALQIPLGATSQANTSNNISNSIYVDYCGRYIYKSNTLFYVLTPEGYVKGGSMKVWRYYYNLKDHQGNTRKQVISQLASGLPSAIYAGLDSTDYYTSGLETLASTGVNTSGGNPYLYSGKEMEKLNGLFNYDFSARWMNPVLSAFTTPDPLGETRPWDSPYSYCGGNPVNRTDPTGLLYYGNGDGSTVLWVEDYDKNTFYDYRSNQALKIYGDGHHFSKHSDEGKATYNYIDNKLDSTDPDPVENNYNDSFLSLFSGGSGSGGPSTTEGISTPGNENSTLDNANSALGAAGTLNSIGINIAHDYASYGFKSANGWQEFSKLASNQQAWRAAREFGKTGANILKGAKVLGTVAGAATAAYSGYKAYGQLTTGGLNNMLSHRDVYDAGVGTLGTLAAIGIFSNPVGLAIGTGVLVYGVGTLVYDCYDN